MANTSLQLGKNAAIGFVGSSTQAWGTETLVTTLLPGWGGAHGVSPEMGYSGVAGDAFQNTDHAGLIKAAGEFKGPLAYQGYEYILGCCFGKAMSAPSGSAGTGYTHVYDFATDSNNVINMTVSQYEGLAGGMRRTARSARVNSFSIDVPKTGPVQMDVKMLADYIINGSAINTQAVLQALTAAGNDVYRQKILGWHFAAGPNQAGYIRMGQVGAYKLSPYQESRSGAVTSFGAATFTGTLWTEQITITWTGANAGTVSGSISGAMTPITLAGAYSNIVAGTSLWQGTLANTGTAHQAADTTTFWIQADPDGADVALASTDGIFPNHHKYSVDWHQEGTHGPARTILQPYGKSQPMGKCELSFDDDEGTNVDPNNVLKKIKAAMATRAGGGQAPDFKYEAYAEASVFAGTATDTTQLKYSMLIQIPRLSLTLKDTAISGPGPQAAKIDGHFLKPFAAPTGMSGVTGIFRITLVCKLSTAPVA